jgi:hypothetical protein
MACGRFSDNTWFAAGKKRGFCRLLIANIEQASP